MAYRKCPGCGEKISDKDKQCPYCGHTLAEEDIASETGSKKKKTALKIVLTSVLVIAAVLAMTAFTADLSMSQECRTVNKQISEIGRIRSISENDGELIRDTREKYDRLSDNDKKFVWQYHKLENAEHKYDKAMANAVISEINDISQINEESGAELRKIGNDYDGLTGEQQKLVTNYDVFEKAEEDYDKLTADNVNKAIVSLENAVQEQTEPSYTDIEVQINELESSYSKLTDRQKELVEGYEEFEHEIADLKLEEAGTDRGKARAVDRLIRSARDKMDAASGRYDDELVTAVNDARAAYDALNGTQKKLVSNNEILDDALKEISDYQVNSVQEAIDDVIDGRGDFESAEQQYEKLDKEQKEEILAYDKFKARKELCEREKERQQYIDRCEEISYDELVKSPDIYKDRNVMMKVEIIKADKDILIFKGDITAKIPDTEKLISIKNKLKTDGSVFSKGEVLTVYGTADGLARVKTYDEGSGLFGTDLFAKEKSEIEVPVISAVYSSNDSSN